MYGTFDDALVQAQQQIQQAPQGQFMAPQQPQQVPQPQMVPQQPQIVGHVPAPQNRQTEGFNVTGSVGGGTEIADLGGTGGATEDQVEVVEVEGMKCTNTNTGKPKGGVKLVDKGGKAPAKRVVKRTAPATEASAEQDNVCRKIAKAICKDFPDDYVFTNAPRQKIARLQADYFDRPDVIRAVAAAETDGEVKAKLVQEFPEAFQ
jgi:hypothetical protein